MKLTENQYNRLKPYEEHLHRAFYGQYVFGMMASEAKELFEIYNEIFKKNEKSTSCGRCRLNVATALGRLFYEYTPEEAPESTEKANVGLSTKAKAKKKTTKKDAKSTKNK